MEYQTKISVIVPVYNVASYLRRCLDSIVNQTFKDFEVILIDDGSTDNSLQICMEYKEKYSCIRIHHQENGGLSRARNVGLALSKGKYIIFIDSDDYIHKEALQIMYNYITSKDVDYVAGGYIQTRSENSENFALSLGNILASEKNQKRLFEEFFRIHGEKSNYSNWGKLFSRKVLNGWHSLEGRINEDVDGLFQIICKTTKALYIDNALYFYFKNGKGITQSQIKMKNLDLIYVWDQLQSKVKEFCPEYMYDWEMNRIRADFTILSRCIINGYDRCDTELKKNVILFRNELRHNFAKLIKWKISFARKILLFIVCYVYPFGNIDR